MEARDLRIGNLVLSYGTNGNPSKFVEITVNAQHIDVCSRKPEWFNPIPLTEEWLQKLGFVKRGDSYNYHIHFRIRLNLVGMAVEVLLDNHYWHMVENVGMIYLCQQ